MIGSRTRSREVALQVLFAVDTTGITSPDLVELQLDEAEAPEEVKAFARELVEGVRARREEIDGYIATAAQNWELSRLATVDRNVLRLATFEMLAMEDIPPKVSINEGIELGKRYSTAQSGAFINGILDRIRKDLHLPIDETEQPC